ncbi:ATP-binding cassette domain-containing protein [Streptomyces sp. NPDC088847]|uniref:ATP-binding cassette domain-containing protein n=1 Tax=Streptomyces sp. NPDC088847 TaxID=3365909 RepID=UPI003827537F
MLEELASQPSSFVKNPAVWQGRLLICALRQPSKYFTAMQIELALGSQHGTLESHLFEETLFFERTHESMHGSHYRLTQEGLSNAHVLDKVWREMHAMLEFRDTHARKATIRNNTISPTQSHSEPRAEAVQASSKFADAANSDFIIQVQNLRREFKSKGGNGRIVQAVQGVDITVKAAEIVGFLGPNGAGKTTTLRMLTTLLRPTSGSALVTGIDLLGDPRSVRKRIGYVAQGNGTSPESKVVEELEIQGRLHGLSRSDVAQRIGEVLHQMDLEGLEDRLTKTLSGGQRRRLDIALGLIHLPDLLFLDEPTTGLDPQNRANLWSHVRRLRNEHGMTIFLTTHYLEEADALCDRIMIMDAGQVVAQGTPQDLKASISGDKIELSVPVRDAPRTALIAERLTGAQKVVVTDGRIRLRVPRGDAALPVLLRELNSANISPRSFQISQPSLDDVFLSVTGRRLRDSIVAGRRK